MRTRLGRYEPLGTRDFSPFKNWLGLDPKSKKVGNQLLDAFFLWTAEHSRCDYFLTMDFRLVNMTQVKNQRIRVVRPSELEEILAAAR